VADLVVGEIGDPKEKLFKSSFTVNPTVLME